MQLCWQEICKGQIRGIVGFKHLLAWSQSITIFPHIFARRLEKIQMLRLSSCGHTILTDSENVTKKPVLEYQIKIC